MKKINYFGLDLAFFQDIKIRKLIRRQGSKSVGVYLCILCTIYRDGYFAKWDDDLPFIIGEQTGCDDKYVLEVIGCCISLGLLDKGMFDQGVLTSTGIQERYKAILLASRRKCDIAAYSLIDGSAPAQEEQTPTTTTAPQPQPTQPRQTTPQELDALLCSVRDELASAGVEQGDITEALRLMNGETHTYVYTVLRSWLDSAPPKQRFYEVLQLLQSLEQKGRVKAKYDWAQWQALSYVQNSKDISSDERKAIMRLADSKLDDIYLCVREIKRGKINLPGKFILARLHSKTQK